MRCEVLTGDCVEVLTAMSPASVDAVVTDPPYGLEFMGKEWDRLGKPGEPEFSDVDNPYGRGKVRYGGSASYGANAAASGRAQQEWHEAWAREALRVLKPGGHLLAFGGTRTYHRLACALEDAGFELRDEIMWLYGSGFPKSLDVAKSIDKEARGVPQGGADPTSANHGRFKTRATEGSRGKGDAGRGYGAGPGQFMAKAGEHDDRELVAEAWEWDGWGTALKPAHEPIVVARKPFVGTVAGNVLEHGTGAINVDGCRVGMSDADRERTAARNRHSEWGSGPRENAVYGEDKRARGEGGDWNPEGRWPANVVLSHDEDCVLVGRREVRSNGHFPSSRGASGYGSSIEDSNGGGLKGQEGLEERRFDGELVDVWACVPGCPVRILDEQTSNLGRSTGTQTPGNGAYGTDVAYGDGAGFAERSVIGFGDAGGASRFFYTAKASRAERNAGLDVATEERQTPMAGRGQGGLKCRRCGRWKVSGNACVCAEPTFEQQPFNGGENRNPHPTVKPIDLMRWLVRLVTPPGGLVLDPFCGSGSTGCAAVLEGFEFVGIEREQEYVPIAEARIRFWREHPTGLPIEAALVADAQRRRARDAGQLGFEL